MSDLVPVVADMNHNNPVNFGLMAKNGIVGVIHKASQGNTFNDPAYSVRRVAAKAAGLLWGAYHFVSGEDPTLQVERFFNVAKPDDQTVMVLDFEDNPKSQMSLGEAVDFLHYADQKLGRPVDIYSGNRIKETIIHADAATRAFLARRRLWLCEYGPKAKMVDANGHAMPWEKYWLWQRWADGAGTKPIPHIPGLEANADLSVFIGTPEELRATWVIEQKVEPALVASASPIPSPVAAKPVPTLGWWSRIKRAFS